MKKCLACIFILLLHIPVAGPILAEPVADQENLLQIIDRNLQPPSYQTYRKLINIEPDGTEKEFTLYTAKKGTDKVVSLFLAPASEKGRSTLRLGENMWLYIPNVGKPLRITSLQSVVGGVFNNSDIMRLDFADEYKVERLLETEDRYQLTLRARDNTVAYDRLEMTVDKKNKLPLDVACHATSGMLIKTLHYKEIKDFGNGIVRPAVIETDSPLYKGYKSVMIFAGVEAKEFSDEAFTLSFLPRVEEMRR